MTAETASWSSFSLAPEGKANALRQVLTRHHVRGRAAAAAFEKVREVHRRGCLQLDRMQQLWLLPIAADEGD
eukprot:CAMPEP_0182804424 /NCGR_PEP_ID=MMETSP0006_2-20121128/4542_1 /TAXON_ID=97485 /ORGANISM="Prymnesium parvum, Strain Texoma1" /LENGTH=71 /DNA_ID=CAMNT_0024929939 /DNA_START=275 /DNA_END=489 /DNA_ORIENTATION=+